MASLTRRLNEQRSAPNDFGCQFWTGYCNPVSGYGQITVPPSLTEATGWSRTLTAPWAAAFLAHGGPESGQVVLHRCNVAECCADEHLHWGSYTRNMQDRVLAGGQNTAKLVPSDVYAIRTAFSQRRTGKMDAYRDLAETYGVGERTIRGIILGEIWSWLE